MNGEQKKKNEFKRSPAIFRAKWFKRTIAAVIILAIAGGGFAFFKSKNQGNDTEETQNTAVITRGDIEVSITGSGTVEANETYNIVPTINGEIIESTVEEGDMVEEGQILYRFDSEQSDNAIKNAENSLKTAANSVESAKISLQQAQENVSDLTVTATAKGIVSGISVTVGDSASGTICSLSDTSYMIMSSPIPTSSVNSVSVGNSVKVTLERYMTSVSGTVSRISNASVAGANGAMVTYVEIKVPNPGSIAEGTMATATIQASSGNVESAAAAALNYPDTVKITAEQSGTVSKLNVKNGDWVNSGDVIAVLTNSSVTNQLRNAQMSYDNSVTSYENSVNNLSDTRKEAEDYTLTAPISGKVLSKSYKKGDTVYGTSSTTLMVIADVSKMKFTLNVDELDVATISVGQSVTVTADAIEGQEFEGIISTVSLLGTASNGVTYYPVEITIDNPGNLLPGMNVDAEIITGTANNAILAPVGAVSYYDGNYYVTVVGEINGENAQRGERPTGDMQGEMPTGDRVRGERPDGEQGEMPTGAAEGGESMPMGDASGNANKSGKGNRSEQPTLNITYYDEPQQIQVTTGISNDDYTVIIEGLSEGMVVVDNGTSSSESGYGMMMGMGGMGGGGMGGGPMR